jgi:methylglutaconyl-CoA hydratase
MSTVRLDVDHGVATVGWDRRDVRNAMDAATARELTSRMREMAERDDVGAIILQPADGAFCAGWDIDELRGLADATPETITAFLEGNLELLEAVVSSPQVTVALVDGPCLGFGAALAARCDISLATDRSTVGFPEATIGVLPAIAALDVVAVLPPGRAVDWLATGRVRPAGAARDDGLLGEVVAADEFDAAARGLRASLASAGPSLVRGTKQLVTQMVDATDAQRRRLALDSAVATLRGPAVPSERANEGSGP